MTTLSANDRGLTANQLQGTALLTMLLDHMASGFLEAGSGLWIFLRTLGRLSMPVMCFFIVEGYFHTRNVARYTMRLLAVAVLAHFPFTLYFDLDPLQNTSVLWGLAMGLLALAVWDSARLPRPVKALLLTLLTLLSIPADWGYISVFWIVGFGALRCRPVAKLWMFVLIGCIFYLAPVAGEILDTPSSWPLYSYRLGFLAAVPVLASYHGVRGQRSTAMKWGFYLFYPAHLLVLLLLKQL